MIQYERQGQQRLGEEGRGPLTGIPSVTRETLRRQVFPVKISSSAGRVRSVEGYV